MAGELANEVKSDDRSERSDGSATAGAGWARFGRAVGVSAVMNSSGGSEATDAVVD